jgi:hypothetical protein
MIKSRSHLASLFGLTLAILSCLARAEDPPTERRHNAGPLTKEDFQAAVPDPLPRVGRFEPVAHTDTDIRFQMQYRYRHLRRGAEATLTDIDIYAVLLPGKSWLSPRGEKIIDHEQGHFDITQMYALDACLQLKKRLHEGNPLVGKGANRDEAAGDLNRQIVELLRPVCDRVVTAQQEYDRQTNHGQIAGGQAAHRKQQLELLGELIVDLKELMPDDE